MICKKILAAVICRSFIVHIQGMGPGSVGSKHEKTRSAMHNILAPSSGITHRYLWC